jgi:hypothetical protein
MSKERELLRRALEAIEQTPCWTYNGKPTCGFEDLDSIYDEIEAHLAAEEGKQEEEPFGELHPNGYFHPYDGMPIHLAFQKPHFDQKPLFLHPSPQAEQRKPLSEKEIMAALSVDAIDGFQYGFWSGVRFAEKHHKIGED